MSQQKYNKTVQIQVTIIPKQLGRELTVLKNRKLHAKFINSTTKVVNYKHSIPNSEKLGDLKLSHSCNPKVLFYRVTHQLTVLESCVSKNEFIEA